MKNINEFINEALNNMPKEFMNIWKGKPANIDREYFENIALLAQSIMDVHRRNLPTEEEFMNLCEWMIENIDNDKAAAKILEKMYEVFGVTNRIDISFEWDDNIQQAVKKYQHSSNRDNSIVYAFFAVHKLVNKKYDGSQHAKDAFGEHIEGLLKKWNLSFDEWPDYYNGYHMLSEKFSKK